MRKLIAKVMLAMVVFFALPYSAFAIDEYNNILGDDDGALSLKKSAEPVTDQKDQWEITLELTGINKQQTSDIVLVMDTSKSMEFDRIAAAKNAANNFVSTLLSKSDNGNRIALISFASEVTVHNSGDPFKDYNGKTSLETSINSLEAIGGTFTQGGLKKAQDLLESSNADQKFIVLLSDGVPTFSYPMYYGYREYEHFADGWNDYYVPSGYNQVQLQSKNGKHYQTEIPQSSSAFNYTSKVGAGLGNLAYIGSKNNYYHYYYNNARSTIAESNFIRNNGTVIYSVGLEAGTEGQGILDQIAPDKSYEADPSDLNIIFQEIAGNISYAASSAIITDTISDMFTIPGITSTNYNDKLNNNMGTVHWDSSSKTITWDVNKVMEGNPATLSYILEIDSSAKKNVNYDTNPDGEEAYVSYVNANGSNAQKVFNNLLLGINVGTINIHRYNVNEKGQPINPSGEVVAQKEYALLDTVQYTSSGDADLSFGKTYTVVADSVFSLDGIDYEYNSLAEGADDNSKEIALTKTDPIEDVWYGYTMDEESVQIYLEASKGINDVVKLDWTKIDDAEAYILEKSDSSNFDSVVSYEVVENVYESNITEDDGVVYFRVKVKGEEYYSNIVSIRVGDSDGTAELYEPLNFKTDVFLPTDLEGEDLTIEFTTYGNDVIEFLLENIQIDEGSITTDLEPTYVDGNKYTYTLDYENAKAGNVKITTKCTTKRNSKTDASTIKDALNKGLTVQDRSILDLPYYIKEIEYNGETVNILETELEIKLGDTTIHSQKEIWTLKNRNKPQGLQ